MRSRRSDGLWIVLLGLLALTAALSALPKPRGHAALVLAQDAPQRNVPSSV
ncbi:MAG TPA: hypothetical protein VF651_08065 [Gammaproteobacteria bacterium]